MSLWSVFPESILGIAGILYLPYLAVLLYAWLLLLIVKFKEQRSKLLLFVLVTAITNIVIMMTLGPSMGNVLIPSLLLIIMVLPLLWLIPECMARNRKYTYIFSVVAMAGWTHSLGWVAWIYAFAGS